MSRVAEQRPEAAPSFGRSLSFGLVDNASDETRFTMRRGKRRPVARCRVCVETAESEAFFSGWLPFPECYSTNRSLRRSMRPTWDDRPSLSAYFCGLKEVCSSAARAIAHLAMWAWMVVAIVSRLIR
jgi:hypothetical protein